MFKPPGTPSQQTAGAVPNPGPYSSHMQSMSPRTHLPPPLTASSHTAGVYSPSAHPNIPPSHHMAGTSYSPRQPIHSSVARPPMQRPSGAKQARITQQQGMILIQEWVPKEQAVGSKAGQVPRNFRDSQREFVENLKSGRWRLADLIIYFRSMPSARHKHRPRHQFPKTPKHENFIAKTLQGYTCKTLDMDRDGERSCVKVALKFLVHSGKASNLANVPENIINEKKIMQRLIDASAAPCHPGICRYTAHWETQGDWGEYYLAMEYCSAASLGCGDAMSLFQFTIKVLHPNNSDPIKQWHAGVHPSNRRKFYPTDKLGRYPKYNTVRNIFRRVVHAVQSIHSRRVAHLDLSLENVMISGGTRESPLIKIIDFGVAVHLPSVARNLNVKTSGKGRKSSRTFPNTFDDIDVKMDDMEWKMYNRCVGKVQYYGPEVREVRDGRRQYFDAYAADVWTLGIMLYLMMYREYPFKKKGMERVNKYGGRMKRVGEFPLDIRRLKRAEVGKSSYLRRRLTERGLLCMITEQLLDVLERILVPQEDRITIEELLQHPFCRDN